MKDWIQRHWEVLYSISLCPPHPSNFSQQLQGAPLVLWLSSFCSCENWELGHLWFVFLTPPIWSPAPGHEIPPFQNADYLCSCENRTLPFPSLHWGFLFCFLILKNFPLEILSTTGINLKSKNMHVLWSKSVGMSFMFAVNPWCRVTALKRPTSQVLKNDLCESTEHLYSSILWSWEGTERWQHCHLLWHPLSSRKEETGNLLREHYKGSISDTQKLLIFWMNIGISVYTISVVHSVGSAWMKGSAIRRKNSPAHSNTCVNTLLGIIYEVTCGV